MASLNVAYKITANSASFNAAMNDTKEIAREVAKAIEKAFDAAANSIVKASATYEMELAAAMASLNAMTGEAEEAVSTMDKLKESTGVELTGFEEAIQSLASFNSRADETTSAIMSLGESLLSSKSPAELAVKAFVVLATAILEVVGAASDAKSEFQIAMEELEAYKAEAEEAAQAQADFASSFEEGLVNVELEGQRAEALGGELAKLSEKTNKTAAEKERMAVVVDQLNRLLPGLGLIYDKETDSMNKSIEATKKFIEVKKSEAALSYLYDMWGKLQAQRLVQEASQQKATKTSIDLERERQDIIDEASGSLQNSAAAQNQFINAMDEQNQKIAKATETEALWSETMEGSAELLDVLNEQIETESGNLVALQGALEATGEAENAYIVNGVDISEKLQAAGMSAEEAGQKIDGYAQTTQNAFERIEGTVDLTVDEMIENLNENQEMFQTWAENMAFLAKTDLDEGFLETLRSMGPEAAGAVQNMVDYVSKTGSFEKLNQAYLNGGRTAVETLAMELGSSELAQTGPDAVDEVASGIEESSAVPNAMKDTIDKTKVAASEAVEANNFKLVGMSIAHGIGNGINKNVGFITAAARSAARAAYNAAMRALEAQSPSKLFMRVGKTIPQGLAGGILADTEKPVVATKKMAQSALYAFNAPATSRSFARSAAIAGASLASPQVITLAGDVQMDGFAVGSVVWRNVDDVAAFSMRG